MLFPSSSVSSLASVDGLVLLELAKIAEVVALRNQNAITDAFHHGSQHVEALVAFNASRTNKQLTTAFRTDVYDGEHLSVMKFESGVAVVEEVVATKSLRKKTKISNLRTAATTTTRPSRAQQENIKPTPTTSDIDDSHIKAEKRRRRVVNGDLLAVMLRPQATPWTV
ncbi:hypothetical protein MPER_13125 [Moniliophthora perniciosa FA553]|nr:hypothetical protein MPER_13125 [Moniliophthora perniciosa FA553]